MNSETQDAVTRRSRFPLRRLCILGGAMLSELIQRWKTWKGKRRIYRLPSIGVTDSKLTKLSQELMEGVRILLVYDANDNPVGHVTYSAPPFDTCLYIFNIETASILRRQGYATAALWYLTHTHRRRITPVLSASGTNHFWNAVQKLGAAGLVVTSPISHADVRDRACQESARPYQRSL